MTDEFLVESSSDASSDYSPDKFYTAATNKKGFSTTYRVNVPPEVLNMIGQLVASKAIPEYTTPYAFFRDAIVHRIKQVQVMVDEDRVVLSKLGSIMIAQDASARFLAERQGVEHVLKNYEESLRLSDGKERAEVLASLRSSVEDTMDSTFRAKATELLRQYG